MKEKIDVDVVDAMFAMSQTNSFIDRTIVSTKMSSKNGQDYFAILFLNLFLFFVFQRSFYGQ